jgi:PKHD-type hydroxylase
MYKSNYYTIPTAIDKKICGYIKEQMQTSVELEDAKVGSSDLEGRKVRNRVCQVGWLNTDCWIAGMMAHFIHYANINYFGYELTGWASQIQYTKYDGSKTQYNWHTDTDMSIIPNQERKLSISLMLSERSEYEGGNFQIITGDKKQDIELNIGDALIFPSFLRHRVSPIKNGCRETLVGWYGGPYFC